MGLREYNPSSTPAEAWEIAQVVVDTLLIPDSTLQTMLQGPGRVFAHRFTSDPPGQGEWGRVVFRTPLILARRNLPSVLVYDQPFDLLIEVANSDDAAWNPDRAAADIYSRVYFLIVGTIPVLTRGGVHSPFRAAGVLSALMADNLNHSFFANGTFRLVLTP